MLFVGLLGHNAILLLQFYNTNFKMIYSRRAIRVLACVLMVIAGVLGRLDTYFTSPISLYLSDQNYTTIFNQAAKDKTMIGILFTNKFCKDCYAHEADLVQIIGKVWKLNKIRIYRCEISANEELQQYFAIKRFPIVSFMLPYQASYIPYQMFDIIDYEAVKNTINRLQYTLKHRQLSQNESKASIYIDEGRFFFAQQQELTESFTLNPIYQNLPYVIFSEEKQLKKVLISDGIAESDIANCVIYWREKEKCFSPAAVEQLAYTFSMINFQRVIQFTQQTYKSYQQLRLNRYIFIAVLDSIFDRESSNAHLKMLNNLLQRREFRQKITIFWMQTQINKQKLKHLGFKETDHPPLFSLFDLTAAPKKILTDEKSQPVFSEQAISGFIKGILKFDEMEELVKWNRQLLQQSLKRLKIYNEYKLVQLKQHELKEQRCFILSFPAIQYELLGQAQIFYRMILNYRYLVERVNRFAENRVSASYLTFEKYQCNHSNQHGLFYIESNQCHQISTNVIFQHQQTARQIRKYFHLPNLFWINEDRLQEYLLENSGQISQNDFEYVYI